MKRRWPLWTLLAVGLHALPLAFLRKLGRDYAPDWRESETDLEVDVEVATPASAASEPAPGEPTPALAALARPRAQPSQSADLPAERVEEGSTTLEPATPEQPALAAEAPRAEGLSLAALGVGDRNPFVGSDLARPKPKPVAERPSPAARLERSLADAQLRADHARSLGPAGPVLSALVKWTRNSEAPANSTAVFSCVADASGKLIGVELVESSTDPMPWRRIGRRVLAALAAEVLRLPKTGQGASFRIRVNSRQTLPSGADPGLDVTVLGIPVQHGDGEKSGRIDILDPIPKLTVTKTTLPSGQTIDLPTLSLGNILNIAVDPVDIGAPAQRVVHAHVESMTIAD